MLLNYVLQAGVLPHCRRVGLAGCWLSYLNPIELRRRFFNKHLKNAFLSHMSFHKVANH